MEAVGNSQWFIQLLERLGHEIWIGDAAQIPASYVRRQKTDRRDAGHSEAARGGQVSPVSGAELCDARSSPVVDPPPQAGTDSQSGKERTATPDDEPGRAAEVQAMERPRKD